MTVPRFAQDVPTILVNGRQMTIAVFKQLPTWAVFTPRGEPWPDVEYLGRVRYAFDGHDEWIVMRSGGELRRGAYSIPLWQVQHLLDYLRIGLTDTQLGALGYVRAQIEEGRALLATQNMLAALPQLFVGAS